jgi:anhydro-N-acetylmuramic acid kinase
MAMLERRGEAKKLAWVVPNRELVEGKEAMAFAWFGLLRWLGIDNALSSVTGAERDSSGGALWGQGAL